MSGFIRSEMEKEIGDIDKLILEKDGISKIQGFLREKIHQHQSVYTPTELIQKNFKIQYDSSHLISYLNNKYKSIY